MPSDTPSPVTRLEVISVGTRQRWTPERKRELVLETFALERGDGEEVEAVERFHRGEFGRVDAPLDILDLPGLKGLPASAIGVSK